MSRICSDPYADDEMQSLERTPRASFLDNFSCWSWSVVNGGPKARRLSRYPTRSGRSAEPVNAGGALEAPALETPLISVVRLATF